VVCFMDDNYLDNPDFTKTVIKNIIDSGKSWLSIYPVFGKPTFRACITNYNTSEEDIEALVSELNEGREILESRIKNQEIR
jgi:aromatic-L-amino-acid/L-tryptophan decarboxylase